MLNRLDDTNIRDMEAYKSLKVQNGTLDFHLNFMTLSGGALFSYNYLDFCFQVLEPPSYTITELVLILPLDE